MTSPTTLLIARHGEAHCNVDQIVGGPNGCRGLTDRGRTQIRRLADRLRQTHHRHPISLIYTTPLLRTRQSSELIAHELGIDLAIAPDLREQDHGIADGLPWTDVVARFGGVPALEPDRAVAHGGETWTHYLDRSARALADILARHEGERVLVVGHGETLDTAFQLFLNIPTTSRSQAGFAAHPASLTHWEQMPLSWTQPARGWRWLLVTHNDTAHLQPDQAIQGHRRLGTRDDRV